MQSLGTVSGTFTGIFHGRGRYGHLGDYPFQLTISRVQHPQTIDHAGLPPETVARKTQVLEFETGWHSWAGPGCRLHERSAAASDCHGTAENATDDRKGEKEHDEEIVKSAEHPLFEMLPPPNTQHQGPDTKLPRPQKASQPT